MPNKAHTAAVRRIAARLGVEPNELGNPDISTPELIVEVETSATLAEGVARLGPQPGRRFIAVTNQESVAEALTLVEGTTIGVMDPQGEIVRDSG